MTVVNAPVEIGEQNADDHDYPIKANTIIYKGQLVCLDTTGFAVPAADTASFVFVGKAASTYDNRTGSTQVGATGANGGLLVRCIAGRILKALPKAAAVQADLGKAALVVDANTVATTGTVNAIKVGVVVGLPDASHVDVFARLA